MNTQIAFTLTEVASFCALILSVGGVVALFAKLRDKKLAPEKERDERIEEMEATIGDFKTWLGADKRRIEALESALAMEMKCLFALLSHAINGNDIEQLKEVQHEMQSYLATKGVKV